MKKIIGSVRFISSFLRLIRDPNRLDLVFGLADGLDPKDNPNVQAMLDLPAVRRGLAGPLPTPRIDLPRLRTLPDGTLGREVARFFDSQGYDPEGLYHTQGAAKTEFDRFKRHMERTHDIWHVVTGFRTDVPGELGLQAFSLAQVGSTLAFVLMAAGMLHMMIDSRDGTAMMDQVAHGWRLGKSARPFFGVDWEALFSRPLTEVQAELGIDVAAEARANAPELRAVAG
jgi:ubiquinone biosynthesis protein Coq4